MIFCTLSNKKYLLQGVALAYSLYENIQTKEYKLYYLCLDDESYNTLSNISQTFNLHIIPIHYSELENIHPELIQLKQKNFSEYCFSFSSLLPKFIFKNFKELSILYIDSDVYFYNTPELLLEEINNKDIGLIRHRHIDRTHPAGEYNVNAVYIKNNINGNKILDWWYSAYLTQTPKELSTCGDQKYLEGFETIIGKENIAILDNLIGHGAPWNYKLYNYSLFNSEPKKIIWNGKQQIFVFNHFSQFTFDFITNTFTHTGGKHLGDIEYGAVFNIPELQNLYVEYYQTLKEINTQLNLNINTN